jgi:hypothetical protein
MAKLYQAEADAVSKSFYPIKSIIGQDKNAVNLKKNLHSLQEPICRCRSKWYCCTGCCIKSLGIGAGDDVIVTSRTF